MHAYQIDTQFRSPVKILILKTLSVMSTLRLHDA